MKVGFENLETPLQEKLETLADAIGKFGLAFAILTFLGLMVRLIIEVTTTGQGWDKNKHPALIVRSLIIAVERSMTRSQLWWLLFQKAFHWLLLYH